MAYFRGSFPAIITPMKNGGVDHESLKNLVEWLLEEKSDGIVACGTTGEGAVLLPEETLAVVRTVKDVVGNRAPVIVGTGSNDTRKSVELTKKVAELKVDAALVVTPYYNKPTPEGLFRHFEKIALEAQLPIIMYNVPGRTGVSMDVDLVVRCAGISGVVGIKDASVDMTMAVMMRERCGENFALLSGDDFSVLPFLACGGDGVITVTGNILPRDMSDLVRSWHCKDIGKARSLQAKLIPVANVLFAETNPVPVKAALHIMGKCGDEIRMPLTYASDRTLSSLREVMSSYGGLI